MKRKQRLPLMQLLIKNAALIIAIALILFGFVGFLEDDHSMMFGLLALGLTFGIIHFAET